VDGLHGRDVELRAGSLEDHRVGLGGTELTGDDDGVEEPGDAEVPELGALVDA
jgi:hypothetical protein